MDSKKTDKSSKNTKIDISKLGKVYPFIPTRDAIVLENIVDFLEIGRYKSKNSVDLSTKSFGSYIVLIPQKNSEQRDVVSTNDLQKYGILTKIIRVEDIAQNKRITVEGIKKVEIIDFDEENNDCYIGSFEESKPITKFKINEKTNEKLDKLHSTLYQDFVGSNDQFKKIFVKSPIPFFKKEDLVKLENMNQVISSFAIPIKFVYIYFNQKSMSGKLDILWTIIDELSEGLKTNKSIDNEIENELKKSLDKQNKEFLLRERLKVTRNLLGEDTSEDEKIEKIFEDKELKRMYPEEVKLAIKREKSKLKSMMSSSPDANITRNYIDLLTQLPWRKTSIEELDIQKVKKILDEQHYGLKDVKERIIEFVAVMINNQRKHPDKYKKTRISNSPNTEINENLFVKEEGDLNKTQENASPIITLLGPPGVGKTSIAKSLAEALGRKFIKISLGGVNDEAEIRGHRKTYVGAMPGKIINAIKRAGVSNPIILLDEIDKMGVSGAKGDPSSALLEVLDPEQNANFQDHFLEIEYDLSKVLFIATANYFEDIPTPLLDRVELIELSSYTLFEKINIAKKYLVNRVIKQNGLDKKQFKISEKEIEFIVKHYTMEAGVRNLQRVLDKLARKVALGIVEGKIEKEFVIDIPTIKKFLGVEKFTDEDKDDKPRIGVVNGLAYTSYGGSTLPIEVTTFPGKGEIKITGQLKDVMQESATVALGYIRANAKEFGIDFNFDESTIQIHVPEGAVPKDGPSAGVTFTTALISALSKKPVSHKVAMTGEITLRGKVLPIGGLKEKSLAALKLGIKTVFIPKDNERNLEDVADEVKKSIKFIPVKSYTEIYNNLFK
ncbi:endopeptidase La [Mesomycoplasma moatsii]|uniref:endopeptidase La n=1 Tax=Mesomycoplasma moatsii TaxID=171287 RepID=UPI0003B54A19